MAWDDRREISMRVRSVAISLGAILTLVAPTLAYYWTQSTAAASLALTAAVVFVLICKLDDITEFSLGPLRAKMRETIAEATATLDQLRGLATTTARAILTDLMAGSMMGGMGNRKRFELHDSVLSSLRDLKISAEQIRIAETEWKKGVHIIYFRAIRKAITDSQENPHLGSEFQDTLKFDEWERLHRTKCENFLEVEMRQCHQRWNNGFLITRTIVKRIPFFVLRSFFLSNFETTHCG